MFWSMCFGPDTILFPLMLKSWLTTEVSNPDYEGGEEDGVRWLSSSLAEANKRNMQFEHGEEVFLWLFLIQNG